MKWWVILGVGIAGGLVGCSRPWVAPPPSPGYYRALDEANQLERARQNTESAAAYGEAADKAGRARTRDFAAFRQARQLELSGDREAALRLYLEIAERNPDGEMASRSLYYAGRMAFEEDELEVGLERMRQVIERYHHKGLAPQAVRRSVQQLREHRGVEAALEFVVAEEERTRGTDVGDTLLFHWADLERERGNWQKALERYERLDELYPYPHSSIWDDAMWEAGQLARQQGEPQRALGYLRKLVSWREDSIPTGTYYTDWTDNAQLLIGQILLEDLGDREAAVSAFEELATFPDARLADDGLWWAATAQIEAGDHRQGCRTLRRLLEDFPYSNKRRQARRVYQEQGC